MRRLVPASLLVTVLVLTLTACFPGSAEPAPSGSAETAGPSPTATGTTSLEPEVAPARDELALSADGMGTLVLGEAPSTDPATQMLVLDPDYCLDDHAGLGAGLAPGDPAAARWIPIPAYRDGLSGDFSVDVDGGVLSRIDIGFTGPSIPTTAGIRVGDSRTAVEAAYPGATIVGTGLTDVFVVTGTHGTLQIEVSTSDPYWSGSRPADVVVYLHATQTGIAPFSIAGTENIAGICPF